MKADIYLHLGSKNIKVLLENGEVWWYSHNGKWKISKHKAIALVNKPWMYTKLSTVNDFKMKHQVGYEIW